MTSITLLLLIAISASNSWAWVRKIRVWCIDSSTNISEPLKIVQWQLTSSFTYRMSMTNGGKLLKFISTINRQGRDPKSWIPKQSTRTSSFLMPSVPSYWNNSSNSAEKWVKNRWRSQYSTQMLQLWSLFSLSTHKISTSSRLSPL
jgi:hypothetical protein